MLSIRSRVDVIEIARQSHHVKHCPDCQRYYEMWEKIQAELYRPVHKEDRDECEAIMAQIGNLPELGAAKERQRYFSSYFKPSLSRQWVGAATGLVVIVCISVFLVMPDDQDRLDIVQSNKIQSEQRDAVSDDNQQKPEHDVHPMAMLADLRKEQALIARDLGKFRTMLNKRVILFRQEL